ncbi:transcriptional regulator, AraC family [Chitinophaga pinensis DSM 2588]|uniref:Transcriptional regulator, AraC family n=2 Tax=Chitinophaga pinensis TaxID=79329 RepID=A0A979GYX2_CHIPD|nr:transcriptional regulator, AraC family [Chitinophaga pinensis DSM 2588]
MMDDIKTFSLSRHSRLFSVPDTSREYLFVRSGQHPYHEEPYRAESYAIVFIREGGVRLNTGLVSWDVHAPAIITLGPSVVRFFTKSSDQLNMDVIFFKDTFQLENHADVFFLSRYEFFDNNDLHVLPLKEPYVAKFSKIYELLEMTQDAGSYAQRLIIRSYIFALIFEIDACRRISVSNVPASQEPDPLFTKFKQLLRRHYIQEHKLDFYARELHLTPKSLSAAIKKQSGQSAGKWIDDAIALEAKVLLQNKTLTVAQISNMLNFSEQSVFGKFFRTNTGMSPLEYRKKFN